MSFLISTFSDKKHDLQPQALELHKIKKAASFKACRSSLLSAGKFKH